MCRGGVRNGRIASPKTSRWPSGRPANGARETAISATTADDDEDGGLLEPRLTRDEGAWPSLTTAAWGWYQNLVGRRRDVAWIEAADRPGRHEIRGFVRATANRCTPP